MDRGIDTQQLAKLDTLVAGLKLTPESADRFYQGVNSALEEQSPQVQRDSLRYLALKLESEKKLPVLLIAGKLGEEGPSKGGDVDRLGENVHRRFSALTIGRGFIRQDYIQGIATGEEDPPNLKPGHKLNAMVLSRNFKKIDEAGKETGDQYELVPDKGDGLLEPYEIKNWAEGEMREKVDVGWNVQQSIKEYENVLKQFGTKEQLKEAFGTETPSLATIQATVKSQEGKLARVGYTNLVSQAFLQTGDYWSADKLKAAQYLAHEGNHNLVIQAKDEGWWWGDRGALSAEKLQALGSETFKTSLEKMAARERRDNAVEFGLTILATQAELEEVIQAIEASRKPS